MNAAVVEPQRQRAGDVYLALEAFDDADDVGRLAAAGRHEVRQAQLAAVGGDLGLEHQAVVAIAAADFTDLILHLHLPAAVVITAEQRGKAGFGIEPRQAQPLDCAVAVDQRGGFAVADQGVVLDPLFAHAARRDPSQAMPPAANATAAPSAACARCVVSHSWLLRVRALASNRPWAPWSPGTGW